MTTHTAKQGCAVTTDELQPAIVQFGAVLYAFRTVQGMTQTEIASRIGVTKTYISAVENSRYPPPQESLVEAIADALSSDAEDRRALLEVAAMERLLLTMPKRLSTDLARDLQSAVARASQKLMNDRQSNKGGIPM